MEQSSNLSNPSRSRFLILFAWITMLLASDFPNVLSDYILGKELTWLIQANLVLLAGLLFLATFWKKILPLWQYFLIFLVLYLSSWLLSSIENTHWWISEISQRQLSFTARHLVRELQDFGIALLVMASVWFVKSEGTDLFLRKGQTNAPVGAFPWSNVQPKMSWKLLGWILSAMFGLGTLTFMWAAKGLTAEKLMHLIPYLPGVLLIAAMNALSEELTYRVSFLVVLRDVVSPRQALLITSVLFGFAHYLHGNPNGIIGFLMTAVAGWFWGRSILDTRGIFWAWFIHFLQDVIIFAFIAMNAF